MQDYTGDVNGPVLWNLNLLDAQGNAISETYGNGLWLQNSFDPATGEPLTRQAGTGGQASNVQNLSDKQRRGKEALDPPGCAASATSRAAAWTGPSVQTGTSHREAVQRSHRRKARRQPVSRR